ncbi:MAG: MogA/MoaB family molybdenum cofactor biosynthesis protein [Synergistes sp.]|nr:MogA/MoaB family molybdenum cofactor biosynthesis protein [Synergistes sp.]
MKILRLYAPSLIGDHTLCYVHANKAGRSCINDVELPVRTAHAGEALTDERSAGAMTIVLPQHAHIAGGDFLSVGENDALLRRNAADETFSVCRAGFLGVSEAVEIWKPISTAVLTVSDKGSRGERVDTAGPELERLAFNLGCVTEKKKIVPDDPDAIRETVCEWASQGINLILTTGGTGLSPRDNTPEALLSIADKVVPGFGEMMRMETLKYTPRAFLTRSVAVVRGTSLIISFPGSMRGASQCFEAISGGLRHAVETLTGLSSECGNHHHSHSAS